MGLNDGFFERYFRYMGDLLKGDLGTSYTTKVPVWDEISARLPVTAKVAFFVIIFAVLIGVPIGILSAVRQYTIIDSITRVMALLGITMPSFWFALLLVLLFSVKLGWLPASGLYGPCLLYTSRCVYETGFMVPNGVVSEHGVVYLGCKSKVAGSV